MAQKRALRHLWKQLKPVPAWAFLVAGVVSGVVSIYALRQNNITMITLRDAVYKADEQDGDVEGALRALREYVYAHMNTNLASGKGAIRPPIQLKQRYEQMIAAEKARAAAINGQVYTEAQVYCERLYPGSFSGGPRVPCIEDYVSKNGTQEQPVPEDLYKFDFVSPTWSPDLAGWSLLISLTCFALFAIRYGLEKWLIAELDA